jgi:ATP-dependent helicase HrpA
MSLEKDNGHNKWLENMQEFMQHLPHNEWWVSSINHIWSEAVSDSVPLRDSSNIIQMTKDSLTMNFDTALPIDAKQKEILDGIRDHNEIIITAETWAWKSTRVPQYLANAWYWVIVTQPRVLAAMSLADRVAEEIGTKLWDRVGYHIWWHHEQSKSYSSATQIKFCTDGLQLIQQLLNNSSPSSDKPQVLVIDEVHEWNQNIEVLIAWIKYLKKQWKNLKLVLMSATIDANALSSYFADHRHDTHWHTEHSATPPPIITVPGRTFPVEKLQNPSHELISSIVKFTREKRNTLVFQPWKKEISETITQLEEILWPNEAVILPLHGDLSPDEQKKIYQQYTKPVIIVSTNIAQTSLTIPYIDAVVDSWKERRIEMTDWIETLILWAISQADSLQRAWRAWRTKEGVYVLCNDTPFHQLQQFPTPEIQRTLLDHTYLKILSSTWLKMEELDFFHQPPINLIKKAKNSLYVLWAINDHDKVTPLGKQLSRLPVDVNTWLMLIESIKHGVVDEMLKIAAIRQVWWITTRKPELPNTIIDHDSDLITQLRLFDYWKSILEKKSLWLSKDELFQQAWISRKSYYLALNHYKNLKEHMRKFLPNHLHKDLTPNQRKEGILKSITAGMLDSIYKNTWSSYTQKLHDRWDGWTESKVASHSFVSAIPKTIQVTNKRGNLVTISFVHSLSKVDPDWLQELAPHLMTTSYDWLLWNSAHQSVFHTEHSTFNGLPISTIDKKAPLSPSWIQVFCGALARWFSIESTSLLSVIDHNKKIIEELQAFRLRTWVIPDFTLHDLTNYYREVLHHMWIQSTDALEAYIEKHGTDFLKLWAIRTLVRDYDKLCKQFPDMIHIDNRVYPVCYSLDWSWHHNTIVVPESDLVHLSHDDFNQGYFNNESYRFNIIQEQWQTLTIKNLDHYKQERLAKYLAAQWNNFLSTHHESQPHSFSSRDGTWNVEKKLFDEESTSYAFLWLVPLPYDDAYTTKWFRSLQDAEEVTATTFKRWEEYSKKILHKAEYDARYHIVYEQYTSLIHTLEQIDWDLIDEDFEDEYGDTLDVLNMYFSWSHQWYYDHHNKYIAFMYTLDELLTMEQNLTTINHLLQWTTVPHDVLNSVDQEPLDIDDVASTLAAAFGNSSITKKWKK